MNLAFTEQENNHKLHLDKFIKDVLLQKDKNFWRDRIAFKEGQVYKLNQAFSNLKRRQFQNQNNDQDSAISDASSNASVSVSSQPFRKKKVSRKNKKPPHGDGPYVCSPKKRTVDLPFSSFTSLSHTKPSLGHMFNSTPGIISGDHNLA